jgi:hypothetical protein
MPIFGLPPVPLGEVANFTACVLVIGAHHFAVASTVGVVPPMVSAIEVTWPSS